MPPKVKITKDDILNAALCIVRDSGFGSLNARQIANSLHCSTQPLFSNYNSMSELQADVINAAEQIYNDYVASGMSDPSLPPYKGSGLAYIRFAKEEKELFKLLFMRDRSGEEPKEEREAIRPILDIIMQNMEVDEDTAYLFHLENWLFVHGIATMAATSYLNWDMDFISRALTDCYQGLRQRFAEKQGE